MIFVTVGMMYGFDRLIKKMDEIAENIEEDVVMQIGESSYIPKNATYFRFALKNEVVRYYENASIIVSHSGVGSILSGLEFGKTMIVVPRLKTHGEAVDDHQNQIARELEKSGKILVSNVEDLDVLLKNIKKPDKINDNNYKPRDELIFNIKNYLQNLESDKK